MAMSQQIRGYTIRVAIIKLQVGNIRGFWWGFLG